MPDCLPQFGSVLLAFLFGTVVVLLDCRQTMAGRVLRIFADFGTDRGVPGLSFACGTLAAVACWIVITRTKRDPSDARTGFQVTRPKETP